MNTLGWLMILAAILIARSVVKGRVMQVGEDLSDAFLALIAGDTQALAEVSKRTGEANTPSSFDDAVANTVGGVIEGQKQTAIAIGGGIGKGLNQLENDLNKSIALAAIKRGTAAKGYRWTATGPDYYDCSGLMWRACQDVGYKGVRFTTHVVANLKGFKRVSSPFMQGPNVDNARVGDLVVWPTHHMGVMTGPNKFYSARSRNTGIGESPIAGFRKEAPIYIRYVG